ncbi:MAG TPA: CHASE3 domain-containing protein, partial [Burkholderiales bacterium]|nr:CHASE3 domain-containing protein [Burkholderiales bacterium]
MKWNVGMKISMGFGLALAILVAIGTVSYLSIAKLTDTAEWVAHTYQVLEKLEAVLSGMKDAETGQRGYIITGEERYLEPFRAAKETINQKVKSLRELTRDNVNQQRRLDILEPLIDGREGKFAELQETIGARKDKARGFDAARQIVLTDKGKNVMDDIRKTIDEMMREENTLLKKRSDEAQTSARNTT